MLQVIPKSKALAVLSALVIVGMWSNAIAAVFCPHMGGSSNHCLMESSPPHSHGSISDPETSVEHMSHTQMSEMDMQDMTMDRSDMRMDQPTLPPEKESVMNEALQFARDAQESSEAITQPNEPCSHCMMHSRSGASYPLKSAVQNSFSTQIVTVESIAETKKSVPSCLTLVDLHDHSPPGSSAPLYVFVSAFRI
jgi:uncharacterized protein involved in copper resistance